MHYVSCAIITLLHSYFLRSTIAGSSARSYRRSASRLSAQAELEENVVQKKNPIASSNMKLLRYIYEQNLLQPIAPACISLLSCQNRASVIVLACHHWGA